MNQYDNFFLPVENMALAQNFYETIGLLKKFDFSDKGMVAYSVGNEEPAIILKDKSKFPDTKPTIWFVVDNVMETYDDLHKKGIAFLTKPFKIGTGMSVEFEDPFGNRLGITDYSKDI